METNNNEKKKKQIFIIAGCVAIILLCVFVSVKTIVGANKENPLNNNDSNVVHPEVLKTVKVGDVTVRDVTISVNNGISNYFAAAINNTKKTVKFKHLYVEFFVGSDVHKISGLDDITLEPGEKKYIDITFDTDIAEVTKINYEIE